MCKTITLEALQSTGAVAMIITVSLAQPERKLTRRWGISKIFQFRRDAIIITRTATTGASRDRCMASTLEALQSTGAVAIIITASLAQLERKLTLRWGKSKIFQFRKSLL